MEKNLKEITAAFDEFILDAYKHQRKGNKAAGVRSRKKTIELQKLFKEWRRISDK